MSDQADTAPVDTLDNDKTADTSNIDCETASASSPQNDTSNEPEKDHTNHQEATDSDKYDDNGDQTSNKSRELKSLLASSKEANLNTNISHKRKKEQLLKQLSDGEARKPGKLATEGKSYKFPVTAEAELGNATEYVGKAHGEPMTFGKRKRDSISENSSNTTDTEDYNRRNKKLTLGDFVSFKPNKDIFCWRCHREGVNIVCETCPRSYHQKCLKQTIMDTSHWPCPECVAILKAESTQTRSVAMKEMTLEHLCSLLKFAVNRMIQCHGVRANEKATEGDSVSEPFLHPVSDKEFPEYKKYIIQPMDLTMLEKNIKDNLYGSTQAFEADAKWLLHNSIIFNSYRSKLTSAAKTMIKICKQEMMEIENCPSCYLKANTKKSTWFVQVCPKPHILVWAKLKGFPYWPAKAMSINPNGMVDVRFFGAHDRAWVHYKDCYLYSKKDPNTFKQKRYDIEKCVEELDIYIDNLKKEYGEFRYAPFRTPLSSENMHKQLVIFLPNYKTVQARRQSIRESIDAKSEESDIENISKEEDVDKSESEESRSNNNSPLRDNDTTMEGYGTDDDVSSDLDHDSRKSQQEKKRSKFRKSDDDDYIDIDNEDDDDTQVPSNISLEKAVLRGNVRTRGGFNNATGKIRVLQMKPLLDDTSSPNEKQRSRRNSDLSVKSDSSRVSNYSDKISRNNIVENVEITLGNEDVGCVISETVNALNGENPKSEGEIKIKPVQVEVENAEFSISPNRVKIADQLIKKLRDENVEKVKKSVMDVDNEETSQINGKTDDNEEPKDNFKQKLKNAYLTILPELSSLPTESQPSTSIDENCISEDEAPSAEAPQKEDNSKNTIDNIKNDEANSSSDTSTIHESSEESLPNEPVTSSSKEDESPKPKPIQLIKLSFTGNNSTSIPESISEKIKNLESGELSISRTKSVRSTAEKPRVIQSKETNSKSSKDAEECDEESHEQDTSDKDANKKKEDSSEGKKTVEAKRKRSTDGENLPEKIKKLESSELSISTVNTKTVSEKDNAIKENTSKDNKNEKNRTVNIFEDLDDDEEASIVDNVALDKGSIIDVIHSSLKYPEKDKKSDAETSNNDKNEENASKKRKLLSDKLNSPAKLVKLVSIESILGNKDNDKDHPEAIIARENIKSEPESEEENVNEEAQMEEKRKYLFALNIHEKSLLSEKKEKETNQIRTRSKAEEQREKSKVDNLSRVIDEVAMNYSSANPEIPQKKMERRKSRSGPPEGEIYVKSFAKIPTPPPPAKQRARKSFPTPLYVQQPLKTPLAKKDLSAFRKDPVTPRNLAPAPEKEASSSHNGGAKAFPSPPPLVATGNAATIQEKGSTITAVRAVGLGSAAAGGLQQSVSLGHVILMSAPNVNYGSAINNSTLNVVSHQNSSLTTTTATLIPQTQKSVLKANALNKSLNVKTSQNYIPHEDAENSGSSSPSITINSNSQSSNEPSSKQKSQEPSVTSTNSNVDSSTNATSKPTNSSINSNNNNSTQPVIEQEDEFSILNGLIPESVSRAVSELLLRPPPRLRPRPPSIISQTFEETVPSSAGDVTAKVNSIAHRMTDYFRGMLVETLEDIGKAPSPEAKITSLQLEIEALKHRHNLEMTEMRKNMCTILKDIQRSIVEEKEKIVEETRAACEVETIRRVESAKLKQWCASCSKEAQFYCCWNTSYCDYQCQQKHWPHHAGKCTQNIEKGATGSGTVPLLPPCTIGQPILLRPAGTRPKPMGRILAKPTKVYMNKANAIQNNVKAVPTSGLTLVETTPGNFELVGKGSIGLGGKIYTASSTITTAKQKAVPSTTASTSRPPSGN